MPMTTSVSISHVGMSVSQNGRCQPLARFVVCVVGLSSVVMVPSQALVAPRNGIAPAPSVTSSMVGLLPAGHSAADENGGDRYGWLRGHARTGRHPGGAQ